MLVGEQPGEAEDRAGHPFVGPAGALLDKALREAGVDRKSIYVTNAVKHFKYIVRGTRRIHATPRVIEIRACTPWLESEIQAIRPALVLALGATAAHALLGAAFRLREQRSQVFESAFGCKVMATAHPSAILRERDHQARQAAYAALVTDLHHAAGAAHVS